MILGGRASGLLLSALALALAALPNDFAAAAGPLHVPLLKPGRVVDGRVGPQHRAVYRVRLEAGQYAELRLDQLEADLRIAVTTADGRPFLQFDSALRAGHPEFAYLLSEVAETFQVEILDLDDTGGTGFRLLLSAPRAAGDSERLRMDAERQFQTALAIRNSDAGDRREEARLGFGKALESMRILGDLSRQADCLIFTAGLYLADRRPSATPPLYLEAIPMLAATDQPVRVGLTWTNLGWAYDNLADFSRALDAHERSLEIYRVQGLQGAEAMAHASLGRIYQGIGAYEPALEQHRSSLELWTRTGWLGGQGVAWINIGRALEAGGDLEGAIDAFDRAAATGGLSPARRGQNALQLARAHRRAGRPGLSAEWLAHAAETYGNGDDRRGAAWTAIENGELALDGEDWRAAWDAFQGAAELFAAMEDPAGEAEGLYGMARAERGAARPAQAIDTLERAIERIERTRSVLDNDELRALFLSAKRDYFDLYLQLQLEAGTHPDGARLFAAAERARARALLDGLNAAGANVTPDALPRVTSIEALQRLLDPGEALLSYVTAGDVVLVFVVRQESFEWRRLEFNTPALTERVRNFVELLSQDDGAALWRPIGVRLGEDLLVPLASELKGVSKLTVVPDGPLHLLPFEALPWGGDWLLRQMEVSYAPSAAVFHELVSRVGSALSARRGQAWIFAAPSIADADVAPAATRRGWSLLEDDGFEFAPLPFAAREAEDVAGIVGDRRYLHVGASATESNLKQADLSNAILLHVATHGWISPRAAERSALVLGADESDSGEDGLLRPAEICKLKLNRPLVVLSACESARGPILAAEGVQGLARGFLYAGAQSVVATLWSVRDESSARFMRAFYGEISAGNSPQAALRAAKLRMLDRASTRSPRVWAPYVAIGHGAHPIPLGAGRTVSRAGGLRRAATFGALGLVALATGLWLLRGRRRRFTQPGDRPAP